MNQLETHTHLTGRRRRLDAYHSIPNEHGMSLILQAIHSLTTINSFISLPTSVSGQPVLPCTSPPRWSHTFPSKAEQRGVLVKRAIFSLIVKLFIQPYRHRPAQKSPLRLMHPQGKYNHFNRRFIFSLIPLRPRTMSHRSANQSSARAALCGRPCANDSH